MKILQIILFVTVICVSSLVIVSILPVYDIADQDVIVEMENEGEHDEKCHLTDLNYWWAFGQGKALFFFTVASV